MIELGRGSRGVAHATLVGLGLCAALLCAAAAPAALASDDDHDDDRGHSIRTLSTPADRVSGGDVLVEIKLRHGKRAPQVLLNGHDVTSAFRAAGSKRLVGLVTGLAVGKNRLTVRDGSDHDGDHDGDRDSLTITNYPITGPITSGPHITPYICQTAVFRLPDGSFFGPHTDANCSAPTKITYIYKPVGQATFAPLPSTDEHSRRRGDDHDDRPAPPSSSWCVSRRAR